MSNEIVKFEDSVKERMKGIIADLIPEERWDSIVSATIADFEQNDLPNLVKAELKDKYKEIISIELNKPEWMTQWGMVGEEVSEMVSSVLVDSAPQILASMFGGVAQSIVQDIRNRVQIY